MTYLLTATLELEVDAPDQFSATDMIEEVFGSSFGIEVKTIVVKPSKTKKK